MSEPRFSIPIPPCGDHPGGAITCTEPQPAVYVLTWVSPPENRITTAFLRALLTALDVIEYGDFERGVVITMSGIPKFYSNGADLDHAVNTDGFWQLFHNTWARFLTYVTLFWLVSFCSSLRIHILKELEILVSRSNKPCPNTEPNTPILPCYS